MFKGKFCKRTILDAISKCNLSSVNFSIFHPFPLHQKCHVSCWSACWSSSSASSAICRPLIEKRVRRNSSLEVWRRRARLSPKAITPTDTSNSRSGCDGQQERNTYTHRRSSNTSDLARDLDLTLGAKGVLIRESPYFFSRALAFHQDGEVQLVRGARTCWPEWRRKRRPFPKEETAE